MVLDLALARSARLWHTLRWLRPVQLWGRAWFRFHRPAPGSERAPRLRAASGDWQACARAASMSGVVRFVFLGVERVLAEPCDWNRADWPKLWLYNLHYFDDLVAAGAGDRLDWHRALIERWIAENPLGHGNGWEPYTVSLRIVNWVKWALAGNDLPPSAVQSLAVQARWLRGRLEIHLLGNHLWANAKALVFAGAFFDGDEARRWREKGLALLRRELREQILCDGGHFERSPMYHAILLEDLLDMIQLDARYPDLFEVRDVEEWRDTARRMLRWLRVMTHPDGDIAFFNDAAIGIAPNLAALETYANSLGLSCDDAALNDIEVLGPSGYVRMQAGEAVLIADVAPVGPNYLPGHAHADTLSFELSLAGRRVLVNSGTSTYAADGERLRQRGTAAHNTVVVDGQDSSEVWSSFRVARRARPMNVQYGRECAGVSRDDGSTSTTTLWLRAAHDGYRRLPGRVIHRREWRLTASELRVRDWLEGKTETAAAHFHLHPDLRAVRRQEDAGNLLLANPTANAPLDVRTSAPLRWRIVGAAGVAIESSTWHPRFGSAEPAQVLVADLTGRVGVETELVFDDSVVSPTHADPVSLRQFPPGNERPRHTFA